MIKGRKQRLRHFDELSRADLDDVRRPEGLGDYVTVHPLADDVAILDRLGMVAGDCAAVDLYWHHENDVLFVQLLTERYSLHRPCGRYARLAASGSVNLVTVVPADALDSALAERELRSMAGSRPWEMDLDDKLRGF